MKSLKIALVSDAVLPFNKGGKETRIDYLTRELAGNGYDVHIYTMQWWDGGKTTRIGNITYHAISKLYPLYNGERRSMLEGVLFGVATVKLLFVRFDILEVDHMPFFPIYAAKLVALLRRKKLYATWHEVWGRQYWQEYLGPYLGTVAALIESVSVRLPNHITAVSQFTYDQLRSKLHYKGSLSIVSNGIDYKKIAMVTPDQMHYDVLYAGRLLTHKNVDVLIKAVAIAKQSNPNITCGIIGDGPEKKRLEALVIGLGLENNVFLLGFLESNESIYSHMKSSSVFVLPSSREGFGISLLEAAACGAAIITVDEPDNAAKYLAHELGGSVVRLNEHDVAIAINDSLQIPANSSPSIAKDYDWHVLAQRMSEVYSS